MRTTGARGRQHRGAFSPLLAKLYSAHCAHASLFTCRPSRSLASSARALERQRKRKVPLLQSPRKPRGICLKENFSTWRKLRLGLDKFFVSFQDFLLHFLTHVGFSCRFVRQTGRCQVFSFIAHMNGRRIVAPSTTKKKKKSCSMHEFRERKLLGNLITHVHLRQTDAKRIFHAAERLGTKRRVRRAPSTASTIYVFSSRCHRSVLPRRLQKWHLAISLAFQRART